MVKIANQTKGKKGGIMIEKLPGYFLILCLVLSLVALYGILKPFLAVIFIAAVLAITFYPVYRWILKSLRGWERTSSLLTCLLVVLLIVVPVTLFLLLLAGEGLNTYQVVQEKINSGVFDKYLQWKPGGFFYDLTEEIRPVVDLDQIDLKKNIIDIAGQLSNYILAQALAFTSQFANFLFGFVLMLFSMFYFFKDGEKLVKKLGAISPLPPAYENQLFEKIASMVKAIMIGVLLTAIAQGFLGGIGFAIVGLSNPVFWATAMAFFSLIPMVGTAIIWCPAAIILAIFGDYYAALFIFLWGMILVSSVDNFLRPFLIGGKAHTYPLMTFFVILGGIWTMGLQGVIMGPLVLMVVMSFLHIYELEYSPVLKNTEVKGKLN